MSEHDLATSNRYEINAKSPLAVASADKGIINMAVGKEFNHELQEFHYGYASDKSVHKSMGCVSDNATAVLGLELDHFQIQGTRDYINMGFASNEQLPGITHAVISVGPTVDVEVVWNGGTGVYESLETPGIGDIAKIMVGGRYPMTLTDTTP